MESDAVVEMSLLVNYVEPVHFKGFAHAESRNKCYEMSSFSEGNATIVLKDYPKDFLQYNKRQNSRIYPKGSRVASDNYNPQMFWNVGCQMVALNYQVLDVPMMLNLGFFEYNGKSGYILKHDLMRRKDRAFDIFSESSFEGIITNTLTIKILFGMFLTDRRCGVYVEVDMYGMPADCIRKRFRTKTCFQSPNSFNHQFDDDTFEFKKIVYPNMASLRISVYDDSNKLIGHRVLKVENIENGYRFVKLRNESYQPLSLSTLFVHVITTDYVPSTFSDIADALSDPTAFMSQIEKRNVQLKLLEEENFSANQTNQLNKNSNSVVVATNNETSQSSTKNVSKDEFVNDFTSFEPSPAKLERKLTITSEILESKKSIVYNINLSIGKIKTVVDLAKEKAMLVCAANLYKSYETLIKNQMKNKNSSLNVVLKKFKKETQINKNDSELNSKELESYKIEAKKILDEQIIHIKNSIAIYHKEMITLHEKDKIIFMNQFEKNYSKITDSVKQQQDNLNKEEIKRLKKTIQSKEDLARLIREHADRFISNTVKERQKLCDKYDQQKEIYDKNFATLFNQITLMRNVLDNFVKKTQEECCHSIDQMLLAEFTVFKPGWIPFVIATNAYELENTNDST